MQHSNLTQLTPKKRSLIFVNLVVSGLASSTLATAMTTALPNLVADFGVSTTWASGSPAATPWPRGWSCP